MRAKQNYGGLDLFRLIAAFLVVAIHTSPLTSFSAEADFFMTRILSRVAVPFFFMVTGQFVVTSFFDTTNAGEKLLKYLKKVALLYGIAILIYLPIGIYAGHYQNLTVVGLIRLALFDGTFYHLWFFPACMMGVSLIYLLSKCMGFRTMIIISSMLYVIGLLGDSYYGLIQNVPILNAGFQQGFHLFSYTRNGLFFAPLFLLLGVWLGRGVVIPKQKMLTIAMVISFLIMTGEAFTLHYFHLQRHDSMYLALIPTMVFLYQRLMSFQTHSSAKLRTMATWIYILHPAIIVVVRAAAKLLQLGVLVNQSLLHYFLVAVVSAMAAYLLSIILNCPKKEVFQCGRAWIELDWDALRHNVEFLKSRLPETCKLMPAVKADAYGHGAIPIARALNRMGVDAFCVACVREGVTLRKNGIKGEILVLGYTHPEDYTLLRRYRLTQTVVDYAHAKELNQKGKKVHVHIGVDTGMHRLGERCENMDHLCSMFTMKNLIIDGVFSHLSAARLTPQDKVFTEAQLKVFNQLICELKQRGFPCPKVHLLASYGVINYPELAGDYARVGIALYGVLSSKQDILDWEGFLHPVLSLKARVATVKDLFQNESAGYGIGFTAEHDMKIATIAIGYADGLPRSLSEGAVLIHGCKAPIIGRICMDQTIVDVSSIPDIKAGDVAVIIGSSGAEKIGVGDLAEQTQSITNEILSRLGGRLERSLRVSKKLG